MNDYEKISFQDMKHNNYELTICPNCSSTQITSGDLLKFWKENKILEEWCCGYCHNKFYLEYIFAGFSKDKPPQTTEIDQEENEDKDKKCTNCGSTSFKLGLSDKTHDMNLFCNNCSEEFIDA